MIIGLSGASKSGKNTVANIMKKYLPDRYLEEMFARSLKKIHCFLTNCTMEDLESQEFKASEIGPNWKDSKGLPITHRQLLEHTANRLRDLCPDIWVNTAESSFEWGDTIFTDVRYRNEAARIKSHNGIIIRIIRDSQDNNLESNKELDLITPDYSIYNDGTLEELEEAVKIILKDLNLL